MNPTNNCPTDQLLPLIQDELPARTTQRVQSHLDTCEDCQRKIESLAADGDWWSRAIRNLAETTRVPTPTWPGQDSVVIQVTSDKSAVDSSPSASFLSAPSHPEMLGRIDDFEVEQKIGQGGMGVVFRGFDSSLNRPVAIKVLAPHLASSGVARKRFAREAQAAAAVVHPNVVPIYSVKDSPKRPYIVMALVDGRSLQDHVSDNGPLAIKDIVRIARQIAAGLAEAHKQGLIHRDIKPANILLEKDVSRVLITDFGLARAADDVAMTQTGWLAGTPHYMSPEQARGNDIDRRSDLFSLGSVMYFMATGREPFRAEKPLAILQKIDRDSPLPARNINSELPKTLDRIINRLLEKRPDDRFESAEKLEQLLAKYLAHLQHPQSISKPVVRQIKWPRLLAQTFGIAVLSTALIFAGVLTWSAYWKSSKNPTTPNSPPPAIAADEDADLLEGLQAFEEWESDTNQLNQEIFELQSKFQEQWNPEQALGNRGTWSDSELQSLEWEIKQLEDEFSQSTNQSIIERIEK